MTCSDSETTTSAQTSAWRRLTSSRVSQIVLPEMPPDFSRAKCLQLKFHNKLWLCNLDNKPWLCNLHLKMSSKLQLNILTHSHSHSHSHCLRHRLLVKLKLQLNESFQEATKLILDRSSIQLEPLQELGLIRILRPTCQLPQEPEAQ